MIGTGPWTLETYSDTGASVYHVGIDSATESWGASSGGARNCSGGSDCLDASIRRRAAANPARMLAADACTQPTSKKSMQSSPIICPYISLAKIYRAAQKRGRIGENTENTHYCRVCVVIAKGDEENVSER